MKILIIGQGIAGTVLGWTLEKRGAQVTLADAKLPDAASNLAAGIINPVTGQRYVKTWLLEEMLPVARQVYREMEAETGQKFWHNRQIIRLLSTVEEENNWSSKLALPDYEPYLAARPDGGDWAELLQPNFRFGEIRQAAQVDLPRLVQVFREKWQASGQFWQKKIDPAEVNALLQKFDRIVWATGSWQAAAPNFSKLDWQLSKGEVLFIRFAQQPKQPIQSLLKKKIIVAPLGENLFWAGSNYDWQFADNQPTDAGKQFIFNELSEMLAAKFEVVAHRAAIRPTVRDRRPFVAVHPENSRLGIFNGLGTKGALLAPYWAEHFASLVLT